jgi:hypothetical protein
MNFAPFAFQQQVPTGPAPSPFPSGLTVNLWQGNYTAGSTTWVNDAPGSTAVASSLPSTGFTKTSIGLVLNSSTRTRYFRILSDGIWDSASAYTIIFYMKVNSTNNRTFWSKQSAANTGMAVNFTNNPFILMRAWGSSNQISTASTVTRGSLTSYGFASNSGGTLANNQYYINSSPVGTTVQASILSNRWDNGFPFIVGYSDQFSDASILCELNRLLIFNRKLTDAEMSQCFTYMNANQ